MKFLDEYRDAQLARDLASEIHRLTTRPWRLMEVCGGQTHAIVKFGLDQLLPASMRLIHGPGCPVCVTPLEIIDQALQIAALPGVTLASFGDMLRVPGSRTDLLSLKAGGADIRIVYSPLEAVRFAAAHPERQVVFFAVGFETTAPATALAVRHAAYQRLPNFSMLVAHVRVPPAIEALLQNSDCAIQAFLAAGHVCTIMGIDEYHPLAHRYRVPIVVTGFEPVDILQGALAAVRQLESGRATVENQYARCVRPEGNPAAIEMLKRVFQITTRPWRGLGPIPSGALELSPEFAEFDAARRFGTADLHVQEPPECRSGEVLLGRIEPHQCAAFGNRCTPDHPLGAPMVSSEGACSAYYRYRPQPAHVA